MTNLLQSSVTDEKKDETPEDKQVDGDEKKDSAKDEIDDADYESSEDTPIPAMA